VIVSAVDRERLETIVADRNQQQKYVERARIVLASADRGPAQRIAQTIGLSRPTVWRWQQRFAEAGVEGLLRDKTRKPGKASIAADKAAQLVALTCTEPPHQATHWTGRAMAKAMELSVGSVQRIWRAHKLQPHRLRTFKRSRDPRFEAKLTDIVCPLSRSAGPCRGALARREKPDPGARPHPTRTANQARALPDHDTRLQAPRHHHPVRRAQRTRRDGHRALHAAPPASRVHPFSQFRGASSPR
jgi:transposase